MSIHIRKHLEAHLISDDDIQKVREATDLVTLVSERTPLRQRGHDFWACCPFHGEKTPSFKVDPTTQLWHCFGCGMGGDVFGYVMQSQDMGFADAVRYLADRAHIDITETGKKGVSSSKKQRLREVCEATAKFYHDQLMRGASDKAAKAREYLASRGFGGKVPKIWNLGYAPGYGSLQQHLGKSGFTLEEMLEANVVVRNSSGRINDRFYDRVMFPINDANGECIAFGGRVINEGNPKYLNSKDTPLFHKSNVLYGLDKAKAAMTSTGCAVVVEGYTDVIALHQAGVTNAVATLGTALTQQHIRLLSRHAGKKIVYLFDGDAAGQRAADRALQFVDESMSIEAGKNKIEICAVTLPDNLDPAEFVAAKGADELNALINEATPLISYGIERRLSKYDLATAEGRARALEDALAVLAPIKDSILAKDYAVQIAARVRAREDEVLARLAALKAPHKYSDEGVFADANKQVQNSNAAYHDLSSEEQNRLRIERQFLGLSAQNPVQALEFADVLSKTLWHSREHSEIANALVASLQENLGASAAQIIAFAAEIAPNANSVLTSAYVAAGSTPEEQLGMLARQLQIGDTEEAISNLKSKLANSQNASAEESDYMFQNLVALQKKVVQLRKN